MSEESELYNMVTEIDDLGTGLTDWETGFIEDIINRDQRTFSKKQADIIRRIYDQRV